MKTFALVASLALHLGALSALPANDAHEVTENNGAVKTTEPSDMACQCDVEISAECSNMIEWR
jgi:hypothetical protein